MEPTVLTQKKPSEQQAKHWAGCTLNNYTEADERMFGVISALCDYFVVGKEVAPSGTPHLQFMLCFKTKKRMSQLKAYWPTAHFEVKLQNSTMEEASAYCKKDGVFVEYGVLPQNQGVKGAQAVRDLWEDVRSLAQENRLDEIPAEIYVKHYGNLKRVRSDHRNKKVPKSLNWVRKPEGAGPPNIWYWGEPNTGKSRRAREELGDGLYLKMNNKWWEAYDGEKNVLIEDVDKSMEWMGSFLKIWADRYLYFLFLSLPITLVPVASTIN